MIVSAYYKIPSKQSHHAYIPFLQRWFRSLSVPATFFTSDDMKEEIISWGIPLDRIHFVILPLSELTAFQRYGISFWERQCEIDVEKYHTPYLAAIWYEKKEFVKRAIDLFPDVHQFVWCDAGCVRSDRTEYYFRQFGKRGFICDTDVLHLQLISPNTNKPFYSYPDNTVAAAIMVGNRNAWQKHIELYDKVLQEYVEEKVCVNMDQYVIKSCYDRSPDNYKLHSIPPGINIDRWFFFLSII